MSRKREAHSLWRLTTTSGATIQPPTVTKAGNGYWMKPDEARSEWSKKKNTDRSWGTLEKGIDGLKEWFKPHMRTLIENTVRAEIHGANSVDEGRSFQAPNGYTRGQPVEGYFPHPIWGRMYFRVDAIDWDEKKWRFSISAPRIFQFERDWQTENELCYEWKYIRDIPLESTRPITNYELRVLLEEPDKFVKVVIPMVFDEFLVKHLFAAPFEAGAFEDVEIIVRSRRSHRTESDGPNNLTWMAVPEYILAKYGSSHLIDVIPKESLEALENLFSIIGAHSHITVKLESSERPDGSIMPTRLNVVVSGEKDPQDRTQWLRHDHSVAMDFQTGRTIVGCGYEQDDIKHRQWQKRAARSILTELDEEATIEEEAAWSDIDLDSL